MPRNILAVLIVMGGLTVVSAQTNTLSLADAKQMATERNWDLLAAKSGVDAAQAQLIVAKEFPNPTANFSTAKIGDREDGTTQGNGLWERSYDSIAAVSQLIEIGGKRHDRKISAQAGVAGATARFQDARRLLDQGVTKAYVAALLAGENARVLKRSAAMMQHEREIAQARLKAGDISDSDEKQIENSADIFELQARTAEATAVQARIAVEILLGVEKPRGNWVPAETLAQMSLAAPQSAEATTNALRPDVLAAQADLKQSQADLKLQKAMRIPDPTISAGGEHEPPGGGPPEDTFNVGVSFPLPLWNRNRGEIDSAQATVNKNALALAKAGAQAAADIANAESEYQEASARMARYQDQILPNSQKVRESVAFAYEKGGSSLVDLLEAERADNDARLATAQAMADTASAVADWIAAVGNSQNQP
ncbi:MAG TPA: TolC family protein [Candidatus Sulfotelmatobacter sp.]|jgi:cobalt-zinc-cadmium efflux system outer membrane protein|nr:TolC family protein [Candidatus Sulfotelmatobacter sp.]